METFTFVKCADGPPTLIGSGALYSQVCSADCIYILGST